MRTTLILIFLFFVFYIKVYTFRGSSNDLLNCFGSIYYALYFYN